ncbi:MAG: polysaccharide deacetylase family protein [Eubacterium sp.]|nr:polysaccharide deacetylase family protein [Eubacterium sp.]
MKLSRHYLVTFFTAILFLCFLNLTLPPAVSQAKSKRITLLLSETKQISRKNVISYKSMNPSIATVSKEGIIHAVKAGTAKIVAKTSEENRDYRIVVNKQGMVYPEFSMMAGEHLDLQFSRKPDSKVRWSSTRPSVAQVSKEGIVRAKKPGSVWILGRSDDRTYRCCLQVTPTKKSIIYLTFDDGPNRYSTPKILNILKRQKVQATFFELKPAAADFDLTQRVLKEGHSLALHGYQHKYDVIYRSEKVYKNNLDKLRDLFFQKFGVWCSVTRFPGGSSNQVSRYNRGIMTKLTAVLHNWGYHYFDWNVSSGDAGDVHTPAAVYKNVTKGIKKGKSNVVLMHDFGGNDKTINALENIIKFGKKQGYTFLPITASTPEIHHTILNN